MDIQRMIKLYEIEYGLNDLTNKEREMINKIMSYRTTQHKKDNSIVIYFNYTSYSINNGLIMVDFAKRIVYCYIDGFTTNMNTRFSRTLKNIIYQLKNNN